MQIKYQSQSTDDLLLKSWRWKSDYLPKSRHFLKRTPQYYMYPIEKLTRLEELKPNVAVKGPVPDQVVTVVSVQWFGSEALELTYKGPSGRVASGW